MSMKWRTANCNNRPRRPLRSVLAALALAAALSGCSLAPQAEEAELIALIEPPQISRKPEYTAAQTTIEMKVNATGKLMSEKQENLHFISDNKRISEVLVKPGEKVSKGQVIAVIETDNLDSQLQKKDIEVRQAELNLIEKLRDDERSAIQQELDQLNYDILVHELEDLKAEMEASKLKAPFDGTLVSFSKKVGDTVKAYEIVGVIADLTRLAVAARFSASDLESIAPGMEAVVNINTAGSHTGKVSRLPLTETAANGEDSLDLYVLIELDKFPPDVQANTPLSASVITERKKNAVLIPPAALRTVSGRNYVLVVEDEGNKREVDVEVGISTATEVEIVKGLSPGQKVIGK
ncbi:efflux RND transporter periplasmic adaptor subunit [Paenibacillus tarimensis]